MCTETLRMNYVRYVIFLRTEEWKRFYFLYGNSVDTEGWKWFSLDLEVTENPEEYRRFLLERGFSENSEIWKWFVFCTWI
jgi:hypothetical protein